LEAFVDFCALPPTDTSLYTFLYFVLLDAISSADAWLA